MNLFIAHVVSFALFLFGSIERTCAFSSDPSDSQRGVYFDKKIYSPVAVPIFKQSQADLPTPILDSAPELINLYWKTWSLAYMHIHAPPKGSPLVSNYIDAAFSDHIFQWDTIFIIPFVSYAQKSFSAIESLDNFYARQHLSGYIDREIVVASGDDYVYQSPRNTINPPLFAWIEVKSAHLTGDKSRYPKVYLPLLKYAAYLEVARRSSETKHQLYWNTSLGAGMDNSPRAGSGWVDMSSQMVLMYRSLSEMAIELGHLEDATRFQASADDISNRIQKYMWDEIDGLYYDLDDNGEFLKRRTLACFWPMLAHIPNNNQVMKLMKELQNPATFWRENVWASLAATEPNYSSDGHYWQGGVWAPTNAMIIDGLYQYADVPGAIILAKIAAEKYLSNMSRVSIATNTIWEFYRPDSAQPGLLWWLIPGRLDFVGWSGIGPIQFLIEDILGIHVDASQGAISWYIQNLAHHGIRNLHVGDFLVNLDAGKRESEGQVLNIKVDIEDKNSSNHSLQMDIIWNNVHHHRQIEKGQTSFQLSVDNS